MKKIAFILPFYNESAVIEMFHVELAKEVDKRSDLEVEFIYVNDGSSDDGYEKVLSLRESDPRITVINFSKNYGHEVANTAGLDMAHETEADAVIIMDTDLQDPPEVAMGMVKLWEEGIDVIYGQRRKRHNESKFSRFRARGFYWLLTKLAETEIPPNTSDFRVLDKRVVASVVQYRESDRFLRGIISHVGFTQEPYLFDRADRAAGETHYNFGSLFKLAKTAIFGFSTYPLKAITRIGAFVSLLSVLYGFFAIGQKIVNPNTVLPGWTFMLVAMLFLGGLQMVMLGIMGHYVGSTYQEVLRRPLYIVESVARNADKEKSILPNSLNFKKPKVDE